MYIAKTSNHLKLNDFICDAGHDMVSAWYFEFTSNKFCLKFDAYTWDPIADHLRDKYDEEISLDVKSDGIMCYIDDPSWIVTTNSIAEILKHTLSIYPEEKNDFSAFNIQKETCNPLSCAAAFNIESVDNGKLFRVQDDGRLAISQEDLANLSAHNAILAKKIKHNENIYDVNPILVVSKLFYETIMSQADIHPTSKRFRPLLSTNSALFQVKIGEGIRLLPDPF
jgi:hypothetical protein